MFLKTHRSPNWIIFVVTSKFFINKKKKLELGMRIRTRRITFDSINYSIKDFEAAARFELGVQLKKKLFNYITFSLNPAVRSFRIGLGYRLFSKKITHHRSENFLKNILSFIFKFKMLFAICR